MQQFVLFAAARAGGVEDATLDTVEQALSAAGSVRRAWMRGPRDLEVALDGLGEGVPVVAGGDGALHHVLAAMDARGLLAPSRPVGLVPMGTANDLARSTGVPLDPVAAAREVAAGRGRTLALADGDLGVMCNAAHAGIGVHAAAAAARLKERFGGRLGKLAYRLGGVWAGVSATPETMRVSVDGTPVWDGPALLVGVGIGRTIGGGHPLFAGAHPADDELDVVVAGPRGRPGRVRLAGAIARGRHARLADTVTTRGREVRVTMAAQRWNVDGELVDAPSETRLRMRPAAWRLLGAGGPAAA